METNEYIEPDLSLVNGRIIISIIIISAVSLTTAIGYNERLKLTGRMPFWNVFEVRNIAIFLRAALIIAAVAAIYYCTIAIDTLKARDAKQNDIEAGYLNLDASIFGLIVAVLTISAVLKSTFEEEDLIETATVI